VKLPHVEELVLLKSAAIAIGVFGAFAFALSAVCDPQSYTNRTLTRYAEHLRILLAAMFIRLDVRPIIVVQAFATYVLVALALLRHEPRFLAAVPVALVLPYLVLDTMRRRRIAKIEEQAGPFVVALASALRSTPSIGDAFRSIAPVVSEPLRSEIVLATKQMHLGCTFEDALLLMGRRINSRAFDTALTTMLIGQRLGGNLPTTLTAVGGAIRELTRLDQMSRTKTASARMQLWIIAAAPIALSFGMEQLIPGYFRPLTASYWGYVAVVVAVVCWAVALVLGRRILAVSV
jgi:tight adherence protein B